MATYLKRGHTLACIGIVVDALCPSIIDEYRIQVEDLSSISQNEPARIEAIPKLRALIDSVVCTPAVVDRGVGIEVAGRLNAMAALATGKRLSASMYGIDGAGEGIRTLDPNLGKVVLYP